MKSRFWTVEKTVFKVRAIKNFKTVKKLDPLKKRPVLYIFTLL